MQYMVFFEGLDKTGKTTIERGVRSWRRDRFTYFDRGPWSRHVWAVSYSYRPVIEHTARLIASIRHISVVVHVVRDLDAVLAAQHETERYTRDQLDARRQLFLDAFAAYPPAYLITIENARGMTTADLVDAAKSRLDELADVIGGARTGPPGPAGAARAADADRAPAARSLD